MNHFLSFYFILSITWVGIAQASPLYEVGNRQKGWNLDSPVKDAFLDQVQPIFTQRCVACHGCYEAPCQLNFQSYEGILRGYNPLPLFHTKRTEYTTPTRLVDTASLQAWRAKGFLPVVSQDRPEQYKESLLYRFLAQASTNNKEGFPVLELKALQESNLKSEKQQCVATAEQMRSHFSKKNDWQTLSFEDFISQYRYAGMPFGLPRLEQPQEEKLYRWLEAGSRGPSPEALKVLNQPAHPEPILLWEAFFNQDSAKAQQSARYIYEHIFTALLHFDENPGEYFELVRARNGAGSISEIVTEVPYNPPGVPHVYYRLKKVTRAIVQKTQNIWHLNGAKLKQLETVFLKSDWGDEPIPLPVYTSNNMFQYFSRIPTRVRSQFVRENSRIIVGAMVQGTVCIGSRATYAIADHFWAWFLKPELDPSVQNPTLGLGSIRLLGTAPQPWEPKTLLGKKLLAHAESLDLSDSKLAKEVIAKFRGLFEFAHFDKSSDLGDDLISDLVVQLHRHGLKAREILGAIWHFLRSTDANQEYQEAFERELRLILSKRANKGLTLDDLWTGNNNPNAFLSITRHERSSTVQYGDLEGGLPQSMWVMSYANFERLYYNLVTHFKVWGSLTHKLATWRHMSYVRLEGEDLAISMLPIEQREEVRSWFTRGLGAIKNRLLFPLFSSEDLYSRRPLVPNPFSKRDLLARPAGHPELRGATAQESVDRMVSAIIEKYSSNAKKGRVGSLLVSPVQREWDKALFSLQNKSEISNRKKFAQVFPNISYVRVEGPSEQVWVYSLVANRGYKAHNIVFLENPNKDPQYDTLSVYRGLVGAYPGLFLDVKASDRENFHSDIEGLDSEAKWTHFLNKYGVARNVGAFWEFFDWLHVWKSKFHPGNDPTEQGIADLSQYLIF